MRLDTHGKRLISISNDELLPPNRCNLEVLVLNLVGRATVVLDFENQRVTCVVHFVIPPISGFSDGGLALAGSNNILYAASHRNRRIPVLNPLRISDEWSKLIKYVHIR